MMTKMLTCRRAIGLLAVLAIAAGCATGGVRQPDERPVTATAPTAGLGSLSATERAIAAAVDARNAEGLLLLERLVNINSGTMNFRGVREVGSVMSAELDALGFRTRWVDGTPFGRAGHLVAERTGSGPRILLIGHLDTVFEPSSPFQKFVRVSDTTARGPGIIDMKGGDVIIVQALKALRAAGVLDSMSITAVFMGDEEDSGDSTMLSRATLIEAAKRSQYAIGFEDGSGDPGTAVVSRRGSGSWVVTSTGNPAHSSQIFRADIGAGAIFESARILHQFREQLSKEQFLTFNPGFVLGGSIIRMDSTEPGGTAHGKTNIVAKTAYVTGDMRTISPQQLTSVKAAMRAIVAQPLPQTRSEITFDDGYPPLAPTDGNRRLLAIYDAASRLTGSGPVVAVNPMRAGAADVSFTAAYISSAIDGIGLSGSDGHTDRETADLRKFPSQTKRAAILLYRINAGKAK